MSGLGGLLGRASAGREGAYFLKQSKHAVGNLISQKKHNNNTNKSISPPQEQDHGASADVLPEVLRHSLPLSPPSYYTSSASSFSSASKWALPPGDPSKRRGDAVLNPLRDYVSLPQVTFGPKRWQLPESQYSFLASTANEMRGNTYTHVNPEKLKAAAAGLTQVIKAFAISTIMIFGGSTLAIVLAVSKLQLQTTDDIRVKGRDILQPKIETFKGQIVPLQDWAENMSRKWHIEGEKEIKERPIIKELSKILRGKTPQ